MPGRTGAHCLQGVMHVFEVAAAGVRPQRRGPRRRRACGATVKGQVAAEGAPDSGGRGGPDGDSHAIGSQQQGPGSHHLLHKSLWVPQLPLAGVGRWWVSGLRCVLSFGALQCLAMRP